MKELRGKFMGKAERLMHIILSVRHRQPISTIQLAKECQVTERTLYRDLSSLSKIGVPLYHDGKRGYRMDASYRKEIRLGDLSNVDAELVIFCLYHNPLKDSPHFRQKLMYLKERLLQKFENLPHFSKEAFLNFDAGYEGLNEEFFELISKFLYALSNRKKVVIVKKDNGSKSSLLTPIGIRFRQKSATLVLSSERVSGTLGFDLENIQGFSISNVSFADRPSLDFIPHAISES